ncbi:hypothetical protein [Burkholderia ambifaria]|uniref:hypothetical protein n=1 Tax=Burkholderia ambifaria TaxID=152480 RepID=UPI001590E285|nr:hypothetical protein [Burkholderia ambifaria]
MNSPKAARSLLALRQARAGRARVQRARASAERQAALEQVRDAQHALDTLARDYQALSVPRRSLHAVELFRLRAEMAMLEGRRLDAQMECEALTDALETRTDELGIAQDRLLHAHQRVGRAEHLLRLARRRMEVREAAREETELEERGDGRPS